LSSEITPGEVVTYFWRWFWVGVLALAVIAALIAGSQTGWFWLDTRAVQHQSQVIRLNYATQESDLQQMTGYISSVTTIGTEEAAGVGRQQLAGLRAQALGIGNQACQVAAQLSIPLGAQAGWVHANCANGVVGATSPLRKG
jgi:hypothetical protein